MRTLAGNICPILVPTLSYLGGDRTFLLKRYLNAEFMFASFISSESSFHARLGKKKQDVQASM